MTDGHWVRPVRTSQHVHLITYITSSQDVSPLHNSGALSATASTSTGGVHEGISGGVPVLARVCAIVRGREGRIAAASTAHLAEGEGLVWNRIIDEN